MLNRLLGNTGRSASFLTGASFLQSGVAIVSGILTAKWLLPEELGSFNTLSIFTSYIILIQIGIPSGLSRELPFYFGKKEDEHAYSLAATSKYFMLIISVAIFFLSVLVGLFFLFRAEHTYALGSLVVGATSFQGLYITKYLKVLYRSESHFNKLAKISLIDATVNVFSILLVYQYHFYGLCMRTILAAMLDWYFTEKWKPLAAKAKWNFTHFKELSKVGMPIYFVANIYGLWPTFQRTMILSALGTRALGLYALANIVQSVLNTFSGAISSILFPKMSAAYGAGASISQLLKLPVRLVGMASGANMLILLIGWPLLPKMIHYFLPNYAEGIDAAKWMLVVAVVNALLIFSNLYMVLKKNHLRLISYCLGMLGWYIFLLLSDINDTNDLVYFSQALLFGLSIVALVDGIMYYLIWKKDQRMNAA